MSAYVSAPKSSACGTSFHDDTVCALYSEIVAVLGESRECDNYKVSSQWVLTGPGDKCVTVYDWKETSLYSSDLPTVEVRRHSPIDFHIGGESAKQTRPFAKWLEDKLAALRAGSIEVSP